MNTESLTAPEVWKAIPGYDGVYEVSTLGNVRSTRAVSSWSRWGKYEGKLMALSPQNNGYLTVGLRKDGKDTRRLVHSLVLKTFVGERPEGCDACHENGIRTDNRVENLRWDTKESNQADRKKHGTNMFGPTHPRCRVTPEQFNEVLLLKGQATVSSISRAYGISRGTVRSWWKSSEVNSAKQK